MLEIGDATFEREVLHAGPAWDLVLVDIFTEDCAPCKPLALYLESIAPLYPRVRFVKVNAERCPDVVDTYGIGGVPTVLLLKEGRLVKQLNSPRPKDVEKVLHYYA